MPNLALHHQLLGHIHGLPTTSASRPTVKKNEASWFHGVWINIHTFHLLPRISVWQLLQELPQSLLRQTCSSVRLKPKKSSKIAGLELINYPFVTTNERCTARTLLSHRLPSSSRQNKQNSKSPKIKLQRSNFWVSSCTERDTAHSFKKGGPINSIFDFLCLKSVLMLCFHH